MSEHNFEQIKATLVSLAHKAGELMKEKSGKTSFDDKANGMCCCYWTDFNPHVLTNINFC